MTNVVATPPPPTFLAAGNAATAIAVLDANPALTGLDPGSLIEGVVVGQDARGQTILETEYGQVALTARVNLPVGARVVLQLQGAGARLSAIILSVDGQPIGGLARAPIPMLPNVPPPASAEIPSHAPITTDAPATEVTLSTGTVMTATVLWTAAPSSKTQLPPTIAAAPPLPPADQAKISIVSGTPAIAISPAAAPRPAATAAPTPPLELAAPAILRGQMPPEGSQLSVRVLAIEPPVIVAAAGAPALSAPPIGTTSSPTTSTVPPPLGNAARQLAGITVARGASGQVEIRTAIGVIELPLPSEPPAGSMILLELLGAPTLPHPASQSGVNPEPSSPIELARVWPALRAALATLASTVPAEATPTEAAPLETAAVQALPSAIPAVPQVGPQLGLALLAFAAALEDGKPESWLGDTIASALEIRGQSVLAGHLAADFGRLTALASERGAGDWRSIFIPIQHNGALDQLRLFVRRRSPQQGDSSRRGGAPTAAAQSRSRRFVIELDLSRLGSLQLDGFLKGKRLSLVLRGKRALAPQLRAILTTLFTDANELAGLTGTLSFEDNLPQFPIAPIEALRGKAEPVTV